MAAEQHINDKDLAEILSRYEFNAEQKEQIRDGAELGLTREQIEIYALPEFDYRQMRAIRRAITNGLSPEQVYIIADSRLDWYAMHLIYKCFRIGICPDVVRLVSVERRNCEAPVSEVSLFEIIYALVENGWIRTEEEREYAQTRD